MNIWVKDDTGPSENFQQTNGRSNKILKRGQDTQKVPKEAGLSFTYLTYRAIFDYIFTNYGLLLCIINLLITFA